MKLNELIEKYKRYEGKWNNKTGELARQIFLEDLKQLDEPRKVKVKKFVADWYEEHKDEFEYNVWDWLSSKSESGKIDSKFAFWLNDVDNAPIQTLVNMYQFGYDVEEEKKFFVKIKCLSKEYKYLNYFKSCREWLFSEKEETKEYRTAHTRKELEEAGFSEVFNSPLFEVVEAE